MPNFRGVENAFNAGIRNVSYVISVSESHNKANIRRTHEESLAELQKIMDTYPQMNICVALATVFGCPFEGIPPIQKPVDFAKRVYDMGIRSICLADTIGIADPHQVRETIQAMVETMPDCEFQIHIHDTRGMGLANTLAAIECGITTVQSTLGGLGGCPFVPGAAGNISSEDVIHMCDESAIKTGVDVTKVMAVSRHLRELLGRDMESYVLRAGRSCDLLAKNEG